MALAIVKRRLPKLVAADPVADLGDGLHVAIVGSGSPLPDVKRGCPCAAVIAGGRVYVVDAGERASETMNRMGIAPSRTAAVLMTHFHSDHIGGLGTVNLQRWVADADTEPMRVRRPARRGAGGRRLQRGLRARQQLPDRPPRHRRRPALRRADGRRAVRVRPGEDSLVVLEEHGLKVTAFIVDHSPIEPAVGYRFDYRGRSAVISGDTVLVPTLVAASKGADLLVHDALSPELLNMVAEAAGEAGLSMRRRILADVPDYHATAPDAADAAREAGVGALAITHIVPPLPLKGLEPIFLADAHERFTGPLWLAEDGDLYSLLAGATGVERSRMFGRFG